VNARVRYELRGLAYWFACANPLTTTIAADRLPLGLSLRTYKKDAVGRGLYRRNVHEPGLTRLLLDSFSDAPGGNFIDVGANIGYFTCLMAKLAGPAGRVLAFEPEPGNVALLEHNVRINGLSNVEVHACALGASDGLARLGIYKAGNRGRHSLVDPGSCTSFIEVPVRKLDDLAMKPGEGATSWSLMKIDVEGYEAFVFDGASETLSRTAILAMEYAPRSWKKIGVDPAAVFETLSAHFARLCRIQGTDLVEVTAAQCSRSEEMMDLVFFR